MNTTKAPILTIVLLVAVSPLLVPEPLDAGWVAAAVVRNDPAVRGAELSEAAAGFGRSLVSAQVLPQITLGFPSGTGGTFAWSRKTVLRGSAGTELLPDDEAAGEEVSRTTSAVGARLRLVQALPTDGILTAGIENSMQRVQTGDDDPLYRQAVAATVGVQQPVFTNGKLIDLRMFDAGQELAAELPLRLAQSAADATRNERLLVSLEGFFRVIELRAQISVLDMTIETTQERIAQLRIRARQGTVTNRTVWDSEIDLDELREQRLEARYLLLQAEYTVARSIGAAGDLAGFEVSKDLPLLPAVPNEAEATARALQLNSRVVQALGVVDQRKLERTVSGRQYAATLSAQFAISPAYPPASSGEATVADSYTELFDEEGGWNPSFSLGLSVPLYTGGQARLKRQQDSVTIDQAVLSLDEARRGAGQTVRGLYLRRRMLQDQLALRRSALTLQRERYAERQTLAELESITELELLEAQAQVVQRENSVWRTEADLALNTLRILDAMGRSLSDAFGERTK